MVIESNSNHIFKMSNITWNKTGLHPKQSKTMKDNREKAHVNTDRRYNGKYMFDALPNLEHGRRMAEAVYYQDKRIWKPTQTMAPILSHIPHVRP